MSSFIIKIIAIVTMLCDHSSDAIVGSLTWLNVVGRIAFPLFAFQLCVGYKHSHDINKYATRLLIFALVSQIPFSIMIYNLTGSFLMLNIFFTLLIGLVVLLIYDKVYKQYIKWPAILILIGLAQVLNVDYQAWGIAFILFIYIFCPKMDNNILKSHSVLKNIIFMIGYLVLSIIRFIPYFTLLPINWLIAEIAFTYLPVIFMTLYNGKKGPSLKYFFYAFYPVHILILDLIHYFIK